MKLVYIAGPYRANDAWTREQNIRRAEEAGMRVAAAGGVPVIPHTMYRYFDGTLTDAFWIEATAELLLKCDAAFFLKGWGESEGAQSEYQLAIERIHGAVYTDLPLLEWWLKTTSHRLVQD